MLLPVLLSPAEPQRSLCRVQILVQQLPLLRGAQTHAQTDEVLPTGIKQRPHAVVENVVTDSACRGRGLATACLDYARDIARRENCYKIMLMTGSKLESTLRFY